MQSIANGNILFFQSMAIALLVATPFLSASLRTSGSGLSAELPTSVVPPKVPPVIDATEDQPSNDITTASTVAQLQVQMAALQQKLASVQDSMG